MIYDVFRILRGVIRHGKILTALEDVGYWIFCAFYLLGYFYRENSGELRGICLRRSSGSAGLPCQYQPAFLSLWARSLLKGLRENIGSPVEENQKRDEKRLKISDVSV